MFKTKKRANVVYTDIFDSVMNLSSAKNTGSSVVIPHVCNNIGLFGAGFASAVRQRFPIVATNFELLGKKTKLGYVQYINVFKDSVYEHEIIFANMIAQNGVIGPKNPRPLNYEYLVKCMIDVRNYTLSLNKEKIEIHCPKFGSGLAGGNWLFIEDLIRDIWSPFNITVYGYPKQNAKNNQF